MDPDALIKLYQALGWAGIIVAGAAILFAKYLWPHYLDRVKKRDADEAADKAARANELAATRARIDSERKEFLDALQRISDQAGQRNQQVVAAFESLRNSLTARDDKLVNVLNEQKHSSEEMQKNLIRVLERLPGRSDKER